ncbi:MAG: 3-dehydro-L-gulonate 2-dehydrogenase [Bacteroidota bacterium]
MTRIPFEEMKATITQALIKAGMPTEKAETCAQIHSESSLDGVLSHGLNRVERFVDYIQKGWVDVKAEPSMEKQLGSLEVYNGNLGPGILNAIFATRRAAELAEQHGMGLVGLNNTTHWMRGGTYGWLLAEMGFAGILWTNTEPCMPVWGGKSEAIGNNPFIMAIPRKEGHIVLDMAMSQYSYGKLWVTKSKGEKLPYPGGFDTSGHLSDDPGSINETRRVLPIGYWKGSGFTILLDLMSSLLSGGKTTAELDEATAGSCGGCSQVFMAFNPTMINTQEFIDHTLNETIALVKGSDPAEGVDEIYYPGEKSFKTRNANLKLGIPVDEGVWNKVKTLAGIS